jgi:hypothetical protein
MRIDNRAKMPDCTSIFAPRCIQCQGAAARDGRGNAEHFGEAVTAWCKEKDNGDRQHIVIDSIAESECSSGSANRGNYEV